MANLAMVVSGPAADVTLDVVEQPVESIQLLLDRPPIILVLGRVDVLRDIQHLVRLAVGFLEPTVVRVVVVQVQAELVRQSLQSRGEIIDMGKAAETHLLWLIACRVRAAGAGSLRMVVVLPALLVVRSVVMMPGVRNDVGGILVDDVVMVPANHMTMAVANHMVVVVNVVTRPMMMMVVMLGVGMGHTQRERRCDGGKGCYSNETHGNLLSGTVDGWSCCIQLESARTSAANRIV